VILPYIAIAATGIPAAARSRGFLRWYLLYDVLMTVALKIGYVQWHWPYNTIWRIAEPVGMVLAGAAVLGRVNTRRWPFYALGACAVHVWACNYPNVWPGGWLQAEIHAVSFCCLLFGLALIGERRNAAVAVLFLGTSAALYGVPWDMAIRGWLMWFQAGCYVWISLPACRTERAC
jgi:hypothetical protein